MRIGVAALLVVGAFTLTGCQAASGEVFQHSFNQPLVLGEDPVGQTFRPATDGIAGLDVLVATFGEPVDPQGQLRVVLRDGPGGRVLTRGDVEPGELGNDEWAPVRFSPPVPAPGVAAFELTWDGASPLAVWANVPVEAPRDGDPGNDPYLGGQRLHDGEPALGDLAFRVVGSGGAADAARNLAGLLRGAAGRLADDLLFLGLWLTAIAGAVGLGVYGLRGSARQLSDGRRDQERRDDEEARP